VETTDLIAVGEIIKAQGIKGEVKVVPLTDNPDRFGKLKRVFRKNAAGVEELRIENYRLFKGFVLLKLESVNDLDAANALGRGLIYIPRHERLKPPPGRYYLDEIEGLRVFTITGNYLGVVARILETGANDIYSVRGETGEILIPALKSVVKEIDITAGKMIVELPAGLTGD